MLSKGGEGGTEDSVEAGVSSNVRRGIGRIISGGSAIFVGLEGEGP